MATKSEISLILHLLRRSGFGVSFDEAERLANQGYEVTVDRLLRPEEQPEIDELELARYHPVAELAEMINTGHLVFLYRLVMTQQPLREKLALFWHQVFATGETKVMGTFDLLQQIEIFRTHGMGNFKVLLTEISRDPAMLFWLDNNENHKRATNENWGRELLELFTMGVGNYNEYDVKEASKAFTGWTMGGKLPPIAHYGPFRWEFEYRPEDHDVSEKLFLGHNGRFNGEDIIDVIVNQPACARFLARHLYNFFVADEAQVPAWIYEPPRDPNAINVLSSAFVETDFEIREVLRVLFNSDFFKESPFRKVKSPIDVVAGTLRATRELDGPSPKWNPIAEAPSAMGQSLLDPPSVEGWHTGREWVNSGAFVNRVNFVSDRFSDPELPGIRSIIDRITRSNGHAITAEGLVDRCLEQLGFLELEDDVRQEIIEQAVDSGPISFGSHIEASRHVCSVLALIAGTREYQFG